MLKIYLKYRSYFMVGFLLIAGLRTASAQNSNLKILDYKLQLDVLSKGYDSTGFWMFPRAAAIPGKVPTVVLTMQKWLLNTNDVFTEINDMRTTDLGKTWTKPVAYPQTLGRRAEPFGISVGVIDFNPKYHKATGKILATAQEGRYLGTELATSSRRTAYSVYDADTKTWSDWATLVMPDVPQFYNVGAGGCQRVDLPNGEILLPVYYKMDFNPQATMMLAATVVRCKFDGKTLSYLAHGNALTVPHGRGFTEPSLTKYKDTYCLTIRNNDSAYVAVSKDGLHYDKLKTWRFDDGEDLGSHNTQQHWVTHSDGLFLVYTRRGANNDNVFRHRAPLFIAQVDPERMVVIRSTERIIAPNKGAALGNFGVVNVSENETWVTTSEGMAQKEKKYGADNYVYAARIFWSKPNKTWDQN
jgi:hypothetical protein